MYNNIGAKIKVLAKIIAWIGIIGSVIGGFIFMYVMGSIYIPVNIRDSGGGTSGGMIGIILVGIGIMIVGSLISWISSWFMYGFGELIEKTAEIAKNTSLGQKKSSGMICKCGTKNEAGMKFCQNCGDPL